MKTEVPQNIIERIKKLLELTTSPEENEAKHAMEMAKKLMIKYSVQFEDLSSDQIKAEINQTEYWNDIINKPGLIEQIPSIIAVITPIFGVYACVGSCAGKIVGLKLVGFPVNIEIAKFALDSILAQGLIESRVQYKKFKTVSFGPSFWKGFTIGLNKKFHSYSAEKDGIVVYDKVKEFLKSISKGVFENPEVMDGVAVESGINAGLKAEIRHGINAANTGKLLT